jgi:hypothetical protein
VCDACLPSQVGISLEVREWGCLFTLDPDPSVATSLAASVTASACDANSVPSSSSSSSSPRSVVAVLISAMCMLSRPCRHSVCVLLSDGTTRHEQLSAIDIWSRYHHILQLQHSHHDDTKREHFRSQYLQQTNKWCTIL